MGEAALAVGAPIGSLDERSKRQIYLYFCCTSDPRTALPERQRVLSLGSSQYESYN